MPTYAHGPQRMSGIFDALIKMTVCQWHAPRSQNRRCVGTSLCLMFQQVRKTGKRNRGSSVCEGLISHFSPVPTLTCLRDGPGAREAHVGSRPKWQIIQDRNLESKPYSALRKPAAWVIEIRTKLL